MRSRLTAAGAFAALVLAAVAALPIAAQTGPGALLTLEDPAGDVSTRVGGQDAAGGEAAYPAVDLRGLSIQETPASLTFTLHPAALPQDTDAGADGVLYSIRFQHNGREFQLRIQFALRAIVVNENAYVDLSYRDTPQADWSLLWETPNEAVLDAAAATITVDVERGLFADGDGAAPYPGRSLEGLHAVSQSLFSDAAIVAFDVPTTAPQSITDRMPDTEPYPSFAVLLGIAQTGHARLTSDMPFRASNGETTTFVYQVEAHNLASGEDTFELAATGVPNGYTLVLPVPVVKLPAGDSTTVPVLLTMPFGHQHGSLASFILEMRSLSDGASIGRLEMGVRFLAVPQPAGHHDTVYFHTGPASSLPIGGGLIGSRPGYLNTLEDDPNDQGADDCAAGFIGADPTTWHVSWRYVLQPGLQMGMDVDPAKAGRLAVPIAATFPLLQATLGANLYIEEPEDEDGDQVLINLASMALTEPADMSGNGAAKVFEGQLLPNPEAPRIAYEKGNNLVLWLTLIFQGPHSPFVHEEGPCLKPGGSAVLPLREWHDAVDEVLQVAGGPALSALGPQERLVNPGKAVVVPFSVANPLDDAVALVLEVSGSNAGWASLPKASLAVPAHGTAEGSVIVRAPAGSADQERADLVLQAYAKDRPEVRGLLRIVAVVDTDATHPDDTAVADGLSQKESPGASAIVALGLLGLLAVLRRRRA